MPASPTIDSNNKLPHAQDYRFLKEEAVSLIQSLSGETWTDYNTHDPGITLLEAMCYALTDLGYRTSFEMQDILSPAKEQADHWEKLFYTARQILPCNPLTLLDFRKLIIDTEGVRNAWIEVSDEYEALMYVLRARAAGPSGQKYLLTQDFRKGEEVIRLRGLYKVFVEYEDNVLKDKNEDKVAEVVTKKLQFHRNLCEDFLTVSSVEYKDFTIRTVIQVSEGTDIEMINARIYKVIHDFFSPPIRFYSLEQMLERKSPEEIFKGPVLKYGFIDSAELERSERYKDIHLSDIVRLISGIEGVIAVKEFLFGDSQYAGFSEWINEIKDNQKVPRLDRKNSVVTFVRSGDRHRGTNNKADMERVEAIFSFFESGDFKSRLKGVSRDLPVPQGEYMDIDNYYPFQNNLPSNYGMVEKCIDDTVDRVAVVRAVNELVDQKLGFNLRRIIMALADDQEDDTVDGIIRDLLNDATANASSTRKLINRLLADKSKHPLIYQVMDKLSIEHEKHVPIPELVNGFFDNRPDYVMVSEKTRVLERLVSGTFKKTLFEINSAEEIHALREAYKRFQIVRLGRRKQLTLQLRGFLMVFEQMMSDHLSQLAHTRELLSFDTSLQQTRFPHFIEGIQDMEALFIDFRKYKDSALALMETEKHFIDTRNKMLDHLMARFAESMDKYSFFMQQFLGKTAGKRLISDKIAFLSDYVELSGYRGKGFDYTNADITWDTDNVEGVKKRICRLLGIERYSRRTIAPDFIFIKHVRLDKETIDRHVVVLVDPDDKESVLLESVPYMHETEARQILNYIIEHGSESHLFKVEGKRDKWIYQLKRPTPEKDDEVVASGREFNEKEERDLAMNKTLSTLNDLSANENFHIVEHILLRPKDDPDTGSDDQLLIVRNVPDTVTLIRDKKEEFPYQFYVKQGKNSDGVTIWKLSLLKDDEEVLVVKDDFTFYRHLTRRKKNISTFGADVSNYSPDSKADGVTNFKLTIQDRYLAESRRGYRQKGEMEAEINELVKFFSYELAFLSGKDDDDDLSYYADPYSLQVSIVIPNWPKRFRSPAFKHLLEKTIYLETPSHIFPNIYWLDHQEMERFESTYRLWIKELAGLEEPDADIFKAMVSAVNDLRNK